MKKAFASRAWPLVTALGVALLAASPSAGQPAAHEPMGNWAIEPSPQRCTISRRYGSSDDFVTLGLKGSPMGEAVQLIVIRNGHRKQTDELPATLTIDGKAIERQALSYGLDARGRRVAHLINLDGRDAAALRSASRLRIAVKEGADLSFDLLPSSAAWAALDACLARLRRTWNIDEAAQAGLSAGPKPVIPIPSLISDLDYPRMAVRDRQGGTTGFIMLIDEQGTVQDCTLAQTSGAAVLDAKACAILTQRAHFNPALDGAGKPTKGIYVNHIRWAIVD